jgi:hypothetical protein
MGLLRRSRIEDATPELADDASAVLRDAEESLVAALQESDTAVEAMGDTGSHAPDAAARRRWTIGVAGVVLAALGIMVARRRS